MTVVPPGGRLNHLQIYIQGIYLVQSLVKIRRGFLTTLWNPRIGKVDLVDSMCCLNTCHSLAKPISQ